MKFKYIVFCLIAIFINIEVVHGENIIKDINIDIKIDKSGTAYVTEIWNMDISSGSEVFIPKYNIDNVKISNFVVKDESNTIYENIKWEPSLTFSEKAYKNGIYYVSEGIELCWGISSYGQKTYTLTYTIHNAIIKLNDATVFDWTIVNDNDLKMNNIAVKISSYENIDPEVELWTFGTSVEKEIKNGKIYITKTETTKKYISILVNLDQKFETANILDMDLKHYYKKVKPNIFKTIINFFKYYKEVFASFISVIMIYFIVFYFQHKTSYYVITRIKLSGIKKVDYKTAKFFRDIPCNKDIMNAFWYADTYSLMKNQTDIIGTILLKWLKEEKIEIQVENKNTIIVLKEKNISGNKHEIKFYEILLEASKDNKLEKNELDKWIKSNYGKFFDWLNDILREQLQTLKNTNQVKFIKGDKYSSDKYILLNKKIDETAEQLAGLKRFLLEFSTIPQKEAMTVQIWEEYLMFAQLFGISDEVRKQFKKTYPNLIEMSHYTDINIEKISSFGIVISSVLIKQSKAASRLAGTSGGVSAGGSFGGGSRGGGRGGIR